MRLPTRPRGRPLATWLLIAVAGQLSVRGLVGGAALVAAPSGRLVGASTAPLDGLPVGDFLLSGVALFVAFGVAPGVVAAALYGRRGWAPPAAAAVGAALLGWLSVELLAGFDRPTAWLNLATALALLALAGRRSLRAEARTPG
ncbi:hypothetical protein EXE46_08215 [Halorubrum sp. GN11_10-6_MGM]|uniref:hypothetical protein n=1 Tax=Halorubrum sp. GN11_10-6_MGM TaxID=2518112 RepID=UPI0010F73BD5|nr:hypothetical protein [Halorubrum sp. GN11_10-6_MGM]TKX74513.1 hypothetical protein EXE46_08215 [Halorubrum sp. GN11_10-6_MGM]